MQTPGLYFDLPSGISGDMAVASLLGLLADRNGNLEQNASFLEERLALLGLADLGSECCFIDRGGIRGVQFRVTGPHEHHHRTFADIRAIVSGSGLNSGEKKLCLRIFENLAAAESAVHGVAPEKVRFHEIGAVDSIADIAGFSILYNHLAPASTQASPPPLGRGQAMSMHGPIPVPAPATLELLRGLPVRGTEQYRELTTPTGAAILKTVVRSFGPLPRAVVRNIGIGFGTRTGNGTPNLVRALAFEEQSPGSLPAPVLQEQTAGSDSVVVVEATIDDSTPEEIGFLQEQLFGTGALDAFVTPAGMKKGRPGFNVTAVCEHGDFENIAGALLLHSSTFGLRYHRCLRRKLERTVEPVDTEIGRIRVKIGRAGDMVRIAPEYEDCRAAALREGLPFRQVYMIALRSAERKFL